MHININVYTYSFSLCCHLVKRNRSTYHQYPPLLTLTSSRDNIPRRFADIFLDSPRQRKGGVQRNAEKALPTNATAG